MARLSCLIAIGAVLSLATPLSASPITAPLRDCVKLSDLLLTLTGPLRWTARTDMVAVAYHDPLNGCEPTEFEPRLLLTVLDDDEGGTIATFDPFALLNSCGRFQLDFETAELYSLASLVVDTGRACSSVSNEATGSALLSGGDPPLFGGDPPLFGADPPLFGADPPLFGADPPLFGADPPLFGADTPLFEGDTPELPGSVPPGEPPGGSVPRISSAPEPASLLLLGTGLVLIVMTFKRKGDTSLSRHGPYSQAIRALRAKVRGNRERFRTLEDRGELTPVLGQDLIGAPPLGAFPLPRSYDSGRI